MWGQELICPHCKSSDRIIPTRVGTSLSPFFFKIHRKDHPHACGDKSATVSPTAAGTGIIPTRVGTRQFFRRTPTAAEDHPHACGDKTYFVGKATTSLGSSPRVWGQDKVDKPTYAKQGIIPTRVGTRSAIDLRCAAFRDHPHACGDKFCL